MNRRAFLKLGAVTGAAGITSASGSGSAQTAREARPAHDDAFRTGPAIMVFGTEEHVARLRNIAECNRSIRKCLRQQTIGDYLPGQCVYNLGEYPCRRERLWDPDAWDEHELDALRAGGIELIQLHEEWNDQLRLFGGDKFTPCNPAGFRRFVKMVHDRGMKVIVYASTGFFDRRHPDFRREWAARGNDLVEMYWQCACCSPASPGWRAYMLPRMLGILDDYGVDGLYNDLGYNPIHSTAPAGDEVLAFEESPRHDGALNDLLEIVYAEVKRRGGVYKIHYTGTSLPAFSTKVYDYLWVGEGTTNADAMRAKVKDYPPYVAPCLDMSRASIPCEDDLYLHTLPYMQFPVLLAGRPFTGERGDIPGIEYTPNAQDFWRQHCLRIWRHYQAHPEGPHSYGWWDSCPGRPDARPTYLRWLRLYKAMVEPGTAAYLEVGESDLFKTPPPADVVASVFANRSLYLVLANYGQAEARVEVAHRYVDCACGHAGIRSGSPGSAPSPVLGRESGWGHVVADSSNLWTVPARALRILRRA